MSKRLLAFLLALMMTLAFAACGGGEAEEDYGGSSSQAQQEQDIQPVVQSLEPTTSFESNDGFVEDLCAVQVMSKGLDTDTGGPYDMVTYVAGKDTVLYATFAEEVTVESDGSMLLTVYHEGEEVTQLLPVNTGDVGHIAYFSPRSLGDVNYWAAGNYSFEFEYGDSTAVRTNVFNAARKIKVLAVPMINNYEGRVVSCEGEWMTAIQFTKDTYPLANDGIEYVLGSELDLSDDRYDLTTDEGMYNVWEALANLQTPGRDYELILGFARERQGEGSTQGYTYGAPANIITESDGDMQPTVAHEIAHCYNIGDEYPGGSMNPSINSPPYGMTGSDWDDRDVEVAGEKQAVESATDYDNDNTGSYVYPFQMPMLVRELRVLDGVGSYMGSGSDDIEDYWVTSDIWNHLYKAFVMDQVINGASSESGAQFACPDCYESFEPMTANAYAYCEACGGLTTYDLASGEAEVECNDCGEMIAVDEGSVYLECPSCENLTLMRDFSAEKATTMATQKAWGVGELPPAQSATVKAIDITGTMNKDGTFAPTPWYTYETEKSYIDVKLKGEYSIVMEDAAGKVLSTQYFDVSFTTQSNPPKAVDFMPVNVTAQYSDKAAAIKIMKGDAVLHTAQVSANAPVVEFVGIEEDQMYTGKQTVQWQGSDADSDSLWYELWYCPSEDEFISVASNITETSYTVDFDTLPGSTEGYFYLYATDGVNTGEIDSPWIQVEYKAPQIITQQAAIPEYKLTDEIIFDVDVYDKQDGWLWDYDQVNWTLNGRDYLSGSMLWVFPYELTPGEHTFTLTATNSQGVQASQDYTFRILDDESALPDDWSREDIKEALSNGFVAPLQNVGSAITRGQFAKLMANLYWSVWEEGSPEPDYEEGVVTDCGQDDYDQFLMVSLGVMEAPGGKFSPNANLTQEEAAVIMYRLCALADPAVAEDISDIAEIVDICIASGVMDESGDNAYDAGGKITGQLALVRCNRLFNAIFE